MRALNALLAALVVLAPCALSGSAVAQVSGPDPLGQPSSAEWLTYSRTYDGQRHSPLTQIKPSNVGTLQARWIYQMADQRNLQATPIVAGGVMYVSAFNRIDALDARSGNLIWKYQRTPISTGAQRGTGIWNNKLFVTTDDKHLVALDARTGGVLWDVAVADGRTLAGQAPLVAKGVLIVSGNRPNGFIQGYDPTTGRHLWTWSAVPEESDPAYKTWGGQTPEGAPIWVSGTYDPDLNLIYYGTGQPEPQWAGESRPGDNLYASSVVALNPQTGQLKWHFQFTPHDVHDWDALEMPVLIDAAWKGKDRKLLVQANRNGFYYILDRTNGEFLQATKFVSRVDWLLSMDAKGRPTADPAKAPSVEGTYVCPSTAGATNWPSPTYDPALKMFFVVAQEGCGINLRDSAKPFAGTGYMESPKDREDWQLYTRAIDAFTGKILWDYKQVRSPHYGPGLMSTASGVLFSPEEYGRFTALESKTGKVLWNFNTGAMLTASPISYSIDGQQFVAISSGSNVIAFALPEGAAQ
jgi:alcohol dehydrogenase (cytochrome c)